MEEQGAASLWVESATSRTALDAAVQVSFSEDGDFLGSPFSRAFQIGYYEDGLREAEYRDDETDDLEQLLRGASYERVVIPRFKMLGCLERSYNSAILLRSVSTRMSHGRIDIYEQTGCMATPS